MFKRIKEFINKPQFEKNETRENSLRRTAMLVVLMIQKESTEFQSRFILDELRDAFPKVTSHDDLAYKLTDHMASLDKNFKSPKVLEIRFCLGAKLFPDVRMDIIQKGMMLSLMHPDIDESNSRFKFLGSISVSLEIPPHVPKILMKEAEGLSVIYKRYDKREEYFSAHQIINSAASRACLNLGL